ncbi:hypothetical protein GLOIN_2v1628911 [Rhizophagus irregularis DAOM 181602=DAOM 197198]|nr:hypothetical protein GLOIN_2v1628911 [Rhizophagus irregularis DAOM 181602=DAOM 197198]
MKNMRISYFHTLLNSSTIYLKNGFFLFCMWVGGYIFPFFYSFLSYPMKFINNHGLCDVREYDPFNNLEDSNLSWDQLTPVFQFLVTLKIISIVLMVIPRLASK